MRDRWVYPAVPHTPRDVRFGDGRADASNAETVFERTRGRVVSTRPLVPRGLLDQPEDGQGAVHTRPAKAVGALMSPGGPDIRVGAWRSMSTPGPRSSACGTANTAAPTRSAAAATSDQRRTARPHESDLAITSAPRGLRAQPDRQGRRSGTDLSAGPRSTLGRGPLVRDPPRQVRPEPSLTGNQVVCLEFRSAVLANCVREFYRAFASVARVFRELSPRIFSSTTRFTEALHLCTAFCRCAQVLH